MAEKTTVAFRIAESVKNEWEGAASSPEYDSLSHLIRLSVQKELANSHSPSPEEAQDNAEQVDTEVLQSLTRIEQTVTEVQNEVEAFGREHREEELYELEQVLLEVLPTFSEPIDQVIQVDEPERVASATATARDIAGRIGADTSDVSNALERLEENTGQVKSLENSETGSVRYWRRD